MTTSDYDSYAPTYAWTRFAVPWVVAPLRDALADRPGGLVLEVGCGTGNYIIALAEPGAARWCGFDRSIPMLRQAQARRSAVRLAAGDASRAFPIRSGCCALVFAVDVIQHLEDLDVFFRESRRVCRTGGAVVVVTDTDLTFSQRSLTRHFPELIAIERARYPTLPSLLGRAVAAGLLLESDREAAGDIPLDDEFIRKLEAKCSSAMRRLEPHQHAAGMARVRAAQQRGETWHSSYRVLRFGVAG